MVRAPCCEKMGLNKGPWSPEEDQILVSYIQKYGHANWRALPKQAGLLRCGKSCRLRWINYLRPDIKRGNFTKEEEETIINLHQILGNRWSAIAARLPGRTDNEIKNVWHTHLKKKHHHHHHHHHHHTKRHSISKFDWSDQTDTSPHRCSSEISTVTDSSLIVLKKEETDYSSADIPTIDESFWSEEDETKIKEDISYLESLDDSKVDDNSMDYWYNVFIRAGDMPDLPEF